MSLFHFLIAITVGSIGATALRAQDYAGDSEPKLFSYAYRVEFLEIDPKQLGTDTFDDSETKDEQQQLQQVLAVDKDRLRAMHGNAVLSRYPIRSARVVPFTIGYDWFKANKIRPLEKGKRKAGLLIGEDLLRELRRGGRTTLYVDLDVAEAPVIAPPWRPRIWKTVPSRRSAANKWRNF